MWNGVSFVFLLFDLHIHFQGKILTIYVLRISRKWWEIEQLLLLPLNRKSYVCHRTLTFIDFKIRHRKRQLCMFYSVILTSIFKVKHFKQYLRNDETRRRNACCSRCSLISQRNGVIVNVVLGHLDLNVWDRKCEMLICRKRWKLWRTMSLIVPLIVPFLRKAQLQLLLLNLFKLHIGVETFSCHACIRNKNCATYVDATGRFASTHTATAVELLLF